MSGVCVACEDGITLHEKDLLCSYCQIRLIKTVKDTEDLKFMFGAAQIVRVIDETRIRIICNEQIAKHLADKRNNNMHETSNQ